jgi:hypothetical protein
LVQQQVLLLVLVLVARRVLLLVRWLVVLRYPQQTHLSWGTTRLPTVMCAALLKSFPKCFPVPVPRHHPSVCFKHRQVLLLAQVVLCKPVVR